MRNTETHMQPGDTLSGWTFLEFTHKDDRGKPYWLCRCKCGVEKVVCLYNVTSGRSLCCRKCSAAVVNAAKVTHGKSGTKLYRAWQSMKTRCYNESSAKSYEHHGKRGITVAPEWVDDFEAFAAHIGPPPTDLHSVDRIDNNGNYEPGNVRWATQSEQMQNRRPWKKKRPLVPAQ